MCHTLTRHLQTFRLDELHIFSGFLSDIDHFHEGKAQQQLYRPLLSLYHYHSVTHGRSIWAEIWREITTEYNGRAIKGSFKFLDGVVTVRTLRGSKAAQVRGQTPEQLAKTLLRELAREGMAILLISSELPEVLGMSDRILVMHEGRMTGILDRKDANQVKIMELASQ